MHHAPIQDIDEKDDWVNSKLDFDTAWARYMEDMEKESGVKVVKKDVSKEEPILNSLESTAFTQFLDSLLEEPGVQIDQSLQKLNESLGFTHQGHPAHVVHDVHNAHHNVHHNVHHNTHHNVHILPAPHQNYTENHIIQPQIHVDPWDPTPQHSAHPAHAVHPHPQVLHQFSSMQSYPPKHPHPAHQSMHQFRISLPGRPSPSPPRRLKPPSTTFPRTAPPVQPLPPQIDKEERVKMSRQRHIESEKKRRAQINKLYQEMCSLVPPDLTKMLPKSAVIRNVYLEMVKMQERNENLRTKLTANGVNCDGIVKTRLEEVPKEMCEHWK